MPAISRVLGRRAGQDLRTLLQVREQLVRGADLRREVGLLRQREHARDLQLRVLRRRVEADQALARPRERRSSADNRRTEALEQPDVTRPVSRPSCRHVASTAHASPRTASIDRCT
jgi:hypothetical protein